MRSELAAIAAVAIIVGSLTHEAMYPLPHIATVAAVAAPVQASPLCGQLLANLAHNRKWLASATADEVAYHYRTLYRGSAAEAFDRSLAVAEHFGCDTRNSR